MNARKAGADWQAMSEAELLAQYGDATPAPTVATPAPTAEEPANSDALQQAREALQALLGQAPLDEARVIDLITQHAPTPAPQQWIVTAAEAPNAPGVEGAHGILRDLLFWLQSGEHVYLHGPAGTGKTTLLTHAAEALSLPATFNGRCLEAFDLLGFVDANGNYHSTPFRQAYENGGVHLFDEMDSSAPAALVALNAALENGTCVFPDATVDAHPDFRLIGAGNTTGRGADETYNAREPLDGATLDRFVALHCGYDADIESAIASQWGPHGAEALADVRKLRELAIATHVDVIVSMRAIRRLAKAYQHGMPRDVALEQCIYKGLDEDQRNLLAI